MKVVKYVGPLVAYAVYIFIAGSLKDSKPPVEMSDKTAHAIAFGLMVPGALLALGYVAPRLTFAARIALSVVIASALGALLEVWQLLLPWRSSELLDWVADTVGALAFGLCAVIYRAVVAGQRRGAGS
jgi:VanZ family protein